MTYSPAIPMRRAWAMPSPDTFSIGPIAELLNRWLDGREIIIDPFARNSKRGTITNDLNPETSAKYHLPAEDFAKQMVEMGTTADAVLFDPPYSPRQISEVYQSVGRAVTTETTQNGRLYRVVRDALSPLVKPGGIAISFGWNSGGFGKGRGFEQREILLVSHGGGHNDTIVVVEEKMPTLFDSAHLIGETE